MPEPEIYPDIPEELKGRRILKTGDIVSADRGYYFYDNYVESAKKFRNSVLITAL